MRKQITLKGESIIVDSNGTIIWNDTVRKHFYDKDGYPKISFKTAKGWSGIAVHRLIALAFIPNPDNLPEVDHINYNKKDFLIDNLRWVTRQQNIEHSKCNIPDHSGVNNPNYGNKKLSKFYKQNPDIAKQKQGRPGKQNGRYKTGKYMSEKV